MGPAATPRHASGQPGFYRRTITNGQDALASSSEAIAVQIDQVAERMMTALEQSVWLSSPGPVNPRRRSP
jgi:hypothetical protein